MSRTNKSKFAILGCLSIRSMSAYEIKQFINKSVSYFWTEGEGQLYPTLRKLDQEGLVKYKEEEAEKGGTKKIYSITSEGTTELLSWLEKKADSPANRNELLLKLFFGSNQSADANINLLEHARDDGEAKIEVLKSIRESLEKKDIPEKRLVYIEITLDYGIELLTAKVNWCKNSLIKLRNKNDA